MSDLIYAQLVQVAGIESTYGLAQFDALRKLGLEFLQEIRGADLPPSGLQTSFGFVAQSLSSAKTLVVALRGTDPRRLLEWLDDAVALPVPCPWGHGLVHAGFLEVYKSLQLLKQPGAMAVTVADYLKSLLETQQFDNVVVTGHSLGGALATILADHLDFLSHNAAFSDFELSSVTFASPRTGDADWAHWYDLGLQHTTRRYENPWDLVPNLPTKPPFEHVNNKVRLKAPFGLDIIRNHILETYIELLEKQ
jgi:triacylglycerol lipase